MKELLSIGILPVILTLGTYRIGLWCQKKLRTAIANPILISIVLILLFMAATGLTNETYQAGAGAISWLMTPATVCLAIPMYEQLEILRKNLRAMLAGVICGAVSCLVTVLVFCLALHFDIALTVALLPKSVTAAIGVPLSRMSGGIAPITTAAILITGIFANISGTLCCRLFGITEPVAQGVAFGTAGHVIGTAKASELSPLVGAVSSLALVVAGLLTALIFPLFVGVLP